MFIYSLTSLLKALAIGLSTAVVWFILFFIITGIAYCILGLVSKNEDLNYTLGSLAGMAGSIFVVYTLIAILDGDTTLPGVIKPALPYATVIVVIGVALAMSEVIRRLIEKLVVKKTESRLATATYLISFIALVIIQMAALPLLIH